MTTHIFKFKKQTVEVKIKEHHDRIEIIFSAKPYGNFGYADQLQRLIMPLISKYDSDPRPIQMVHPITGEQATIFGDEKSHVAIINPKL